MPLGFKKRPPQAPNPGPKAPDEMFNRQGDNDRTWQPKPQRLEGWRSIWLPHDRQYSYLHVASGYVQFGCPTPDTIAKYAWNQNSNPSMISLPSHVQSPSFPAPDAYQQPPAVVSNATRGSNDASTEIGVPAGATILLRFNVPGNWSGKGQHVEFARNEHIPLEEGKSLGRGASADVHEVICRGVKIARKQIFCSRRMKIEDVKRELEILRKLNHKHVVTLLGSYTQSRVLGLLLFPAAACDLGVYLDELDEDLRSGNPDLGEAMSKICERLDVPPNFFHAKERLNRVYGCLANAVQYLHGSDVRHKDLKPRNILLDRNDGLFVTDFGLSRDTTDASTSVTNGIERGTYKYCAPEVARYEPRGRAADIYSLGCVFLEINTVYRQMSLVEFDTFRTKNEDHSFQNSPEKLKEWMAKLRDVPSSLDLGIFDMMDLAEKMVADLPTERPTIAKIVATLKTLGGDTYFAHCCSVGPTVGSKEHRNLQSKYGKVKQLYFDKNAQIEKLTEALADERLKVQNMEEEIKSLKAAAEDPLPPQLPTRNGPRSTYDASAWEITPSNPSDPDDIFNILDKDYGSKGYLTIEDTKPFLETCGEEVQRHLWKLADVDSDGHWTRDEFDIVLHLMRDLDSTKEKHNLPDTLPLDLVPPSMRGHVRGISQNIPTWSESVSRGSTQVDNGPGAVFPADLISQAPARAVYALRSMAGVFNEEGNSRRTPQS